MGRVVHLNSIHKKRQQLLRSLVIALRELMLQAETDAQTRDLGAYLALALGQVADTIDRTVGPWEKRGYWLKADRFRLEWEWAGLLGERMRTAVLEEDWTQVAELAGRVFDKVKDVKVPRRHNLGRPWEGAWEALSGRGQR